MARKASSPRIRLLLADDHPIVLDGIRSHLREQPEFEVVGQAANGHEAIQKAKALLPDVVLMDITMPQMNGLEATSHLRKEVPGTKVLILTMHDSKEYISQMIRMGARGYLLKDGSPAELVRAIKAVHAGEVVFPGQKVRIVWEASLPKLPVDLSWCEAEIYLSLDGGRSFPVIITPVHLDPINRILSFDWSVGNTPTAAAVLDIRFGCEQYFPETRSVQTASSFVIGQSAAY